MINLNQLGFARPLTSEPMLTVSKNALKSQVLVYVADLYVLWNFATDTRKRHWSIICCITFLTFLKYWGYIFLSPIILYSTLSKQLIVDIGQNRSNFRITFNTLALRPSGPGALRIVKLFNSLLTPLGSTIIPPIAVKGLVPLEGISSFDLRVKVDRNCLLRILALSKVSVFKIHFTLRVLIPDVAEKNVDWNIKA